MSRNLQRRVVKMMDRLESGRSLPDFDAVLIGGQMGLFETGEGLSLAITGRGRKFRRKYLRERRERA